MQLVDASNGLSVVVGAFRPEIEDIFAIQDEIARSVLESLRFVLLVKEKNSAFLSPPRANIEHTKLIFEDVSFTTSGHVKVWSSRDRCSSGR